MEWSNHITYINTKIAIVVGIIYTANHTDQFSFN